jgi:hypothetical protein
MAVAGWFCPSFANSFTLCLIGSSVPQALLTVSCHFFSSVKAGKGSGNFLYPHVMPGLPGIHEFGAKDCGSSPQ